MAHAVVDANAVLRYCLRDVPEQSATVAQFIGEVKAGKTTAFIPEVVLAECIFVMTKSYRIPRSDVARMFRELLQLNDMLTDDKARFLAALAIFETSNFSIVDCLLATRVHLAGGRLLSFDRQLLKYIESRQAAH